MPFIMLALTAIAGAVWWWVRSNPREAVDTAADIVTTVRNAPRRLAFRRQTQGHPVDGIDDIRVAIGTIAQAFIELDEMPTKEQREKHYLAMRKTFSCSEEQANEIISLSRWLIDQCKGPQPAISRTARRLYKINGQSSWGVLQDVLMLIVDDDLSPRQEDAIEDLRIALKIRN